MRYWHTKAGLLHLEFSKLSDAKGKSLMDDLVQSYLVLREI